MHESTSAAPGDEMVHQESAKKETINIQNRMLNKEPLHVVRHKEWNQMGLTNACEVRELVTITRHFVSYLTDRRTKSFSVKTTLMKLNLIYIE